MPALYRAFVLRVSCEDDAIATNPRSELARILNDAADRIARGESGRIRLRDSNGNTVGDCCIRTEQAP